MSDLVILAIIWICVLLASFMANRTRLTAVLWYLFFGSLMVNLGVLPQVMPVFISDFADLGIIIIMFSIGFEEESEAFISSIKRSWGIAFFGALVPFLVAYSIALAVWNDNAMAMLCGLAMTATAVSLTMVSLRSEGLHKGPAATGIMTSAVLDDIASLALVAVMVPLATGQSSPSVAGVFLVIGKAVVFFILITLMGAWLFPDKRGLLAQLPLVGHFNLRALLAMGKGEYTVLALLLIAVLVGLLAHEFGFHPAVGAYMAGLVIRREYFDFPSARQIDHHKQAEEIIANVAYSWIGPVFFVTLGAKIIFDPNIFLKALPVALLLFAGLLIGQVMSAALAARYTGRFSWSDSWMIGFGMLGRAELAFVVMDIAYAQHHVLTVEAFYALMFTCFLLNVSVPISIRWWKSRYASASAPD